mmetsp:Transcript_11106/g.30684  ORF Transcript_11106/g.30684 Transcript_11106/m.30684 type:complete len:264 (+) Transcript_11106:193-984(+)
MSLECQALLPVRLSRLETGPDARGALQCTKVCCLRNGIGRRLLAQTVPGPQISQVCADGRALIKGNQKGRRVLRCPNPPACDPRTVRDEDELGDRADVSPRDRPPAQSLLHEETKRDVVGTKSTSVALAICQHRVIQSPDNDDSNEVKQQEMEERSDVPGVAVLQSDEAVAACSQAQKADGHHQNLGHTRVTADDEVTVSRDHEQRGNDRNQQFQYTNKTNSNFQGNATQSETDRMFAGFRHRRGKEGCLKHATERQAKTSGT